MMIMANIVVKPLFLLRKRCYVAVAENLRSQLSKAKNLSDESAITNKDKKIYWMRDPKSGNWIPENHFDDVDVAELRKMFLPNKHNLAETNSIKRS